jgi:hypothetical protein
MPFGGSCDPEGTIGPVGWVAGIRSDAAGATTRGPGRENGWHAGTGHRPGTSPTWVRGGKNGIERRKGRGAGSGRHWYGGVLEWERPRRRPATVWIGGEGTLSVTRCVTSLPLARERGRRPHRERGSGRKAPSLSRPGGRDISPAKRERGRRPHRERGSGRKAPSLSRPDGRDISPARAGEREKEAPGARIGTEGTLTVTRCVTSLPRCGREGEGRTGSADREGKHPLCHALSGVTSLPRCGREGEGRTGSGHGGRGRWNARHARCFTPVGGRGT